MEKEEVIFDIIDEELFKVIESISGEDDELFDETAEKVYDIIDELIENEVIEDMPDQEDSDEMKNSWVEKVIPLLKEKINGDSAA